MILQNLIVCQADLQSHTQSTTYTKLSPQLYAVHITLHSTLPFLHARILQNLAAIKLHLNNIKTEIMWQQSLITTEGTRGTQKWNHWYQSIMDTPSKN
jgi:hypothetical protein